MVPADQAGGPVAPHGRRSGAASAVWEAAARLRPFGASALPPEMLSSAFGAVICAMFVLSPNTSPTPLHIVLGMIFTTAACPLASALAPAFYSRHRTKVVFLARLVFAHNTAHPWQEELKWQQGALGWPTLLLTLLYSSRGLVASWGALGWQLPLVWHSIVQGLHVVLAGWRLAPAVCQAGAPLHRTPDKLQSLALLLDWPLRCMGGPSILMPPAGACLALVLWFQASVAFILPTALLLSVQRRRARQAHRRSLAQQAGGAARQAAAPATAGTNPQLLAHQQRGVLPGGPPSNTLAADPEDEWSIPAVSLFAAQMLWLLLRVALHDTAG